VSEYIQSIDPEREVAPEIPLGKIAVGDVVTIRFEGTDDEKYLLAAKHTIRDSTIAPSLSIESPVGKAILGAKVGDTVAIKTPQGLTSVIIVSVQRTANE
jgi:transcription elongation factor GreA